jgi:hypothetical protein
VHLAAGLLDRAARARAAVGHHEHARAHREHVAALQLELVGVAVHPADAALVERLDQRHRHERFEHHCKVVRQR